MVIESSSVACISSIVVLQLVQTLFTGCILSYYTSTSVNSQDLSGLVIAYILPAYNRPIKMRLDRWLQEVVVVVFSPIASTAMNLKRMLHTTGSPTIELGLSRTTDSYPTTRYPICAEPHPHHG
jgi:hypothetical protein